MKFLIRDGDKQDSAKSYEGIDNLHEPSQLTGQVAIAWFEGRPDLWATDGTPAALDELRRYYQEWWPDHDVRIDLLSRVP